MILDTEFLISLQAESPDALELAAEFESEGVPTRLPTIVLEELYVGVSQIPSKTLSSGAVTSKRSSYLLIGGGCFSDRFQANYECI